MKTRKVYIAENFNTSVLYKDINDWVHNIERGDVVSCRVTPHKKVEEPNLTTYLAVVIYTIVE